MAWQPKVANGIMGFLREGRQQGRWHPMYLWHLFVSSSLISWYNLPNKHIIKFNNFKQSPIAIYSTVKFLGQEDPKPYCLHLTYLPDLLCLFHFQAPRPHTSLMHWFEVPYLSCSEDTLLAHGFFFFLTSYLYLLISTFSIIMKPEHNANWQYATSLTRYFISYFLFPHQIVGPYWQGPCLYFPILSGVPVRFAQRTIPKLSRLN